MDKPHGKDAVVSAVIEAAIPQIAARGVRAVTLRDIAKAANVNHALIARYFGNKETLVLRTAEELGRRFFEESKRRAESFPGMLSPTSRVDKTRVRAIARIVQEGHITAASSASIKPLISEVIEWLRSDLGIRNFEDPAKANVMIYVLALLLLGEEIFGEPIRKTLGLSARQLRTVYAEAFEMIVKRSPAG